MSSVKTSLPIFPFAFFTASMASSMPFSFITLENMQRGIWFSVCLADNDDEMPVRLQLGIRYMLLSPRDCNCDFRVGVSTKMPSMRLRIATRCRHFSKNPGSHPPMTTYRILRPNRGLRSQSSGIIMNNPLSPGIMTMFLLKINILSMTKGMRSTNAAPPWVSYRTIFSFPYIRSNSSVMIFVFIVCPLRRFFPNPKCPITDILPIVVEFFMPNVLFQ